MSSNFQDLVELFWGCYHIALAILCLWIAVIVFRKRTTATWITLIAAIGSPIFALAAVLWQHLASERVTGGIDRYIEIWQSLYLGYAVVLLTFLIGLLFHLQRRKLESDRIAGLEAILQDLQRREQDARSGAPHHPPR